MMWLGQELRRQSCRSGQMRVRLTVRCDLVSAVPGLGEGIIDELGRDAVLVSFILQERRRDSHVTSSSVCPCNISGTTSMHETDNVPRREANIVDSYPADVLIPLEITNSHRIVEELRIILAELVGGLAIVPSRFEGRAAVELGWCSKSSGAQEE